MYQNAIMKNVILLIPVIFIFACQEQPESSETHDVKKAVPTFEIAPPVQEFTPFEEFFSIDNTKDTVLISDHGSFIHIPSNCFVGEDGQPATDVEIEFTEYSNPADIVFSGIPIEFVTANGNETFQSAGMCEINAKSAGKQVSIVNGKGIDIGLKNRAQDPDYNLYYFNREKGEWVEKEKDLPVDTDFIPVKPVTIATIDTSRIVHIDIQDNTWNRNIGMWDKTQFFLLPGQEPKYHDSAVFWYNLRVIETIIPELFILKLNGTTGPDQVIEILKVQPMIAPENHDAAMAIFKSRMRAHAKKLLGNKSEKQELLSAEETIERIKNDQKTMEKELKEREKKIKEWQKEMEARAKEMQARQEELRIADSIRIATYGDFLAVKENVMRTFQVNQLGLYNCDRFYKREILATKKISFTHNNKVVDFDKTYLCSPRDNAVLNYLRFENGSYNLDLSTGTFYFVGIRGKAIYCKEIDLQTTNGTHNIEEVRKEVFEELMG
jgi:hypothetical protein